jgi:hypothetical protein
MVCFGTDPVICAVRPDARQGMPDLTRVASAAFFMAASSQGQARRQGQRQGQHSGRRPDARQGMPDLTRVASAAFFMAASSQGQARRQGKRQGQHSGRRPAAAGFASCQVARGSTRPDLAPRAAAPCECLQRADGTGPCHGGLRRGGFLPARWRGHGLPARYGRADRVFWHGVAGAGCGGLAATVGATVRSLSWRAFLQP